MTSPTRRSIEKSIEQLTADTAPAERGDVDLTGEQAAALRKFDLATTTEGDTYELSDLTAADREALTEIPGVRSVPGGDDDGPDGDRVSGVDA